MEVIGLNGNIRRRTGGGPCNLLRDRRIIPGILYGSGHQNVLVEFSEMELNDILRHHGEHALINLHLGDSAEKVIIKEVQRDPVNRNLTHIDMKYVKDDERVHADIPVIIKGEDSVASRGGVVQKQTVNLSVKARPDRLPQYFTADVSRLNVGDKLTIADIELSSDITIDQDMHNIVAAIIPSREREGSFENGVNEPGAGTTT